MGDSCFITLQLRDGNNMSACCVHSCSGVGECLGGYCRCPAGVWGMDCSRTKAYEPAPGRSSEGNGTAYHRQVSLLIICAGRGLWNSQPTSIPRSGEPLSGTSIQIPMRHCWLHSDPPSGSTGTSCLGTLPSATRTTTSNPPTTSSTGPSSISSTNMPTTGR